MKKLYFLPSPANGATVSGKWRHRLKNTYKSTDAIRDVIDWVREGREFYVALIDHEEGTRRVQRGPAREVDNAACIRVIG